VFAHGSESDLKLCPRLADRFHRIQKISRRTGQTIQFPENGYGDVLHRLALRKELACPFPLIGVERPSSPGNSFG
jgi:hypothetical protein